MFRNLQSFLNPKFWIRRWMRLLIDGSLGEADVRGESGALPWPMPKTTTDRAEARNRAKAAVAQLKARVARQAGSAAPEAPGDEGAEHAPIRPAARRSHAHPAAHTQRPQGRREGK